MNEYKDFKAKDVDQAIQDACKHYGVERGKLEIEIVSGGSSGIFGLVGKKNAVVKARLRQKPGMAPVEGKPSASAPERGQAEAKPKAPQKAPQKTEDKAPGNEAEKSGQDQGRNKKTAESGNRRKGSSSQGERPRKAQAKGRRKETRDGQREERPKREAKPRRDPKPKRESRPRPQKPQAETASGNRDKTRDKEAPREETRPKALEHEQRQALESEVRQALESEPQAALDVAAPDMTPGTMADSAAETLPIMEPEELKALVHDVVVRLLEPILADPKLVIDTEPGRIKVLVDDQENSGLIIGHQGQTISALQYLANRIVSRRIRSNIRVHLDAGDYRERQDDNLRSLALHLADKAKAQGRIQSTRPLSSYHRRLVHLALQDDGDISTRSKGDGPLKRVLILPRRDRAHQ